MAATADTKVITTHLPLPLADQLDAMAAQLERSRSWRGAKLWARKRRFNGAAAPTHCGFYKTSVSSPAYCPTKAALRRLHKN